MNESETSEAMMAEAKRRGFYIPTEDINSNLQTAIDAACFVAVESNGFTPLLDVVLKTDEGEEVKHAAALFEGVDFSDKREKIKALAEAGKRMGQDLGDKLLPMQVTLMSEAWQRRDLDNLEDKQEVIMAATRSWDGREGFVSRRTIRDLKDKIIDTCPSVEELATDEEAKESTPLLEVFFLGFSIGASKGEGKSPELKQKAEEMEQKLDKLFG